MRTIIDTTRQIVLADDVAQQALAENILNLSAYAEKIQPKIEAITYKSVKKGSIVVALTRLAEEVRHLENLRPNVIIESLHIQSTLCSITFEKTTSTRQQLSTLHNTLKLSESAFFTSTQSTSEITLIAPQSALPTILEHFSPPPKALYQNQVGLSVTFAQKYLEIPNVLYALQAALAVQRVNFTEVVSTYTEFCFVVDEGSLDVATRVLRQFMQ